MAVETSVGPRTRREARGLEKRFGSGAMTPAVVVPLATAPAAAPKNRAGRPRGAASKALSIGALLGAAALMVGTSVPANAFMTGVQVSIAPGTPGQVAGEPQAVYGSASAALGTATRDGFSVTEKPAPPAIVRSASVDFSYLPSTGSVRWPFPYFVPINDGFGPREGGFHKGIDMMAGRGSTIYAIADGVVTTSTFDGGYGQHVVIQHNINGTDVESLYAHMIEGSNLVSVGDTVQVGQAIGLVGDTGYATANHLHFEIHVNKSLTDPFAWLQSNAN